MNTLVTVEVSQVTLTHAITSFLRIYCAGKSDETKKWYKARLRLLAQDIGQHKPLSELLEVDLIQWREQQEQKKLAPDTLHGYIRAIRKLFKWCHQRGLISANLAADLNLPQLPKTGRKGITDHDAALILAAARQHSARDYAMLLFFAATSCRRGGVAHLKIPDLNLQERTARVIEKGLKERTVVMDQETTAALIAYLDTRPGASEFVFVSTQGHPLQADAISEIIDRYKHRLSIQGRVSPHQWRHRWFRLMLKNKMPIAQAAQLGGHENVNITFRYYGQFAMDELKEAYDKYFRP